MTSKVFVFSYLSGDENERYNFNYERASILLDVLVDLTDKDKVNEG